MVFVAQVPKGEDEDQHERYPGCNIVGPGIIHPRPNRLAARKNRKPWKITRRQPLEVEGFTQNGR